MSGLQKNMRFHMISNEVFDREGTLKEIHVSFWVISLPCPKYFKVFA